jgi:hypothetical protein
MTLFNPSLALGGYYPGRPIYDYNRYSPTDPNCSNPSSPEFDHGRCGPTDGPVFDSFINVPSYGDERAFFDARRSNKPLNTYDDPLADVTDSSEAVLRIFVDDDANESFGYKETSLDTTVRVSLPTVSGFDLRSVASISSSNATPQIVEDTADLLGTHRFRIQYVPGSAVLRTGGRTSPVSDEIVTNGAPISNNGDPGVFQPSFRKTALVELHVRVLEVNSRHVTLIVIGTLVTLLLILMAWPAARRGVMQPIGLGWEWVREQGLLIQIIANLLAAGILVLLGWIIKTALSG